MRGKAAWTGLVVTLASLAGCVAPSGYEAPAGFSSSYPAGYPPSYAAPSVEYVTPYSGGGGYYGGGYRRDRYERQRFERYDERRHFDERRRDDVRRERGNDDRARTAPLRENRPDIRRENRPEPPRQAAPRSDPRRDPANAGIAAPFAR